MTAPWCGRPADCPVPDPPGSVDARRIGSTVWPADRAFFHVYELHRGCDEFNPGRGAKDRAACSSRRSRSPSTRSSCLAEAR
ncbi:MAG: hypothetical protein M3Q84_08255 [Actinomycetota bacterium]|nr:hypothetical protein [Actinomycetota bacterium]